MKQIFVYTTSKESISFLRTSIEDSVKEIFDEEVEITVVKSNNFKKPCSVGLAIFHTKNGNHSSFSPRNKQELLISGQSSFREIDFAIGYAFFHFDKSNHQFTENHIVLQ